MTSRRLMTLSVSLALGLGVLAQPSRAQENYLEQAITETRAAIDAGKQSEASSFVEHADEAIDHARSAVWQTPVDPIRKGIKYLRKAVKLAKGTSFDKRIAKATEQAELALQQFETVKH
ncbi:MAG: small metal-binding protein SmbP [Methylocystis sp.]|uniref:small metal-binding protein SmbP n=1 Tax=Methylocystis sp. TaxID=1911079 RepID=UPI003DA3D3AC